MPDDIIRVLIVDDDPEVAEVLDEMVTAFGHQTAVAHNGVQAINHQEDEARELLQGGAFDYVMKPVDFAYLERAIIAAAGVAPPEP